MEEPVFFFFCSSCFLVVLQMAAAAAAAAAAPGCNDLYKIRSAETINEVGESRQLDCNGSETVNATWSRCITSCNNASHGAQWESLQNGSRVTITRDNVLTISDLHLSDTGSYRCQYKNHRTTSGVHDYAVTVVRVEMTGSVSNERDQVVIGLHFAREEDRWNESNITIKNFGCRTLEEGQEKSRHYIDEKQQIHWGEWRPALVVNKFDHENLEHACTFSLEWNTGQKSIQKTVQLSKPGKAPMLDGFHEHLQSTGGCHFRKWSFTIGTIFVAITRINLWQP